MEVLQNCCCSASRLRKPSPQAFGLWTYNHVGLFDISMFPFPWDPIKFPKIHLYDSCWTTESFLDQSFTKQLPKTWIIWLLFLCFLDLCSVLPIIEWPDSYTLFQKRPSSCLTKCQSNNVCGLYTVAFHIQPQNLVCLCYCCQMFCGRFSGSLWWMSPCQWISANLSNFEMIRFSTWLYSSQTKPCCHLKLPGFGYLFFTLNHRYLLPVSLREALQEHFPFIRPLSNCLGHWQLLSAEPSSEGLGDKASSFGVRSIESAWIEKRRELDFFPRNETRGGNNL